MTLTTQDLHDQFEPRPDAQQLTGDDDRRNVSADVDYEPHPEKSMEISEEHQQIVNHITSLYCGSSSEADMQVYAEKAIYDDPYSYCDTRYKIAGKQTSRFCVSPPTLLQRLMQVIRRTVVWST